MPGDNDTFGDVLNLIGEYEGRQQGNLALPFQSSATYSHDGTGILDRHESLAAALGAKLTGPLFLKRIEKFFEGPIKTSTASPYTNPISWLDVVAFAKASPADFSLTAQPNGTRTCRFVCKGIQVEITEDDWRLISSGALDRFPLEHPFEEDETAELATLDILEQRASVLYKKADEVAARARILHHKFGLRKGSISRRRNPPNVPGRFQAINSSQRGHGTNSSYDLHADLLQQFMTNTALLNQSRSTSGAGISTTSTVIPASPASHTHRHSGSGRSVGAQEGTAHTGASGGDVQPDVYRSLVTQKAEKLSKGDLITPPCDRCRRLRLSCVKHLTACQGCTKKHAKCSWKNVTEDEASRLMQEMGVTADPAMVLATLPEVDITPRNSVPPRITEEPSRTGSAVGYISMDKEISPDIHRPDSRIGGIYSPKSAPPQAHADPEASMRRQSIGAGHEARYGRAQGGRDDDPRRASIAAGLLSSSAGEAGASFGDLLNPPR